jgi:hypothetical protein
MRDRTDWGDRCFIEIQLSIAFLLPTLSGNMLVEISLGVHEAKPDKGQP